MTASKPSWPRLGTGFGLRLTNNILRKTSGAKIMIKNLDNGFRVFRGKLKENSEEISSVAPLSPACFIFLFLSIVQHRWSFRLPKNKV